jgi:hypothetical protein
MAVRQVADGIGATLMPQVYTYSNSSTDGSYVAPMHPKITPLPAEFWHGP